MANVAECAQNVVPGVQTAIRATAKFARRTLRWRRFRVTA